MLIAHILKWMFPSAKICACRKAKIKIWVWRVGFENLLVIMVLILVGNSEINAHVRSSVSYIIGLRHLIRSRAVTIDFFLRKGPICLHACATCSVLSSNICTMLVMRQETLHSLDVTRVVFRKRMPSISHDQWGMTLIAIKSKLPNYIFQEYAEYSNN